jgi:ubiquinone/menaquinone biosynthesis C-methylase UbiE
MHIIGALHENLVFGRRTRVLANALAAALPANARSILDVGCGDGTIDVIVQAQRPEVSISGVDILVRSTAHIKVTKFDGFRLPFNDKSFDAVMFVDVLHHTDDPLILLQEAKRVARIGVAIKDHTMDGKLSYPILRFMDWVGNAHHGVVLPYNYWPKSRWEWAFRDLGMNLQCWNANLGLYPFPASLIFERNLHFVTQLLV